MSQSTRKLGRRLAFVLGARAAAGPWHTPIMNGGENDGAAVRIPPPLVYVFAVVAGALVYAFAFPLPLGLASGLRAGVTATAAVVGLALMGSAMGLFNRTGQDPKPWKATPEIISTGIYRFTRNPMYVGMALLQAALGVGLANAWILLLIPAVLVIVYATAIRHEEAYLERKFGDTYLDYRRSVRRWI